MEKLFDTTLKNRIILKRFLTETPREELFIIPDGFNNNLFWNIAHVVVTQQLLVYGKSGKELLVSNELVEKYKKGTVPTEEPVSEDEIKEVEALLLSLPKQTEEDYNKGIFTSYESYTTTPQVTLDSAEDAIAFNVFHEGIHLGSILALRRALAK